MSVVSFAAIVWSGPTERSLTKRMHLVLLHLLLRRERINHPTSSLIRGGAQLYVARSLTERVLREVLSTGALID